MPLINLSQYQFVLSDPWQAGHVMTELEATSLNYCRADLIRKIAIRWVNEAEEAAPDGVLTIEQLDKITEAISKLDSEYQISARVTPKLPAFNHVLRQVALDSLHEQNLQIVNGEDINSHLETAMLEPSNRRKARQQLVMSIRSIYGDGAE